MRDREPRTGVRCRGWERVGPTWTPGCLGPCSGDDVAQHVERRPASVRRGPGAGAAPSRRPGGAARAPCTRWKSPFSHRGTAVAGTIAAPKPSKASEASRRTPSISACGLQLDAGGSRRPVDDRDAARCRAAAAAAGSWPARRSVQTRRAAPGGCGCAASSSRSSANSGSTCSSGSSIGQVHDRGVDLRQPASGGAGCWCCPRGW